MPIPKYKKYYQLMREQDDKLFAAFAPAHAAYTLNPDANAEAFHRLGRPVLDSIRFWERKLCAGMERGANAAYSARVAEKFWAEVRAEFPQIDQVGLKRS
jgi:hypothetical protein